MNAFEKIVSQYLENEGYWVRESVKVDISKEDKVKIGLPTMPRPEIDLVAFNVNENELLLIEAKSYLDSYGVYYEALVDKNDKAAKRFRLFTDDGFREIVSQKLHKEFLEKGLINETTKINYALAAGNIHSRRDIDKINIYFESRGRKLIIPEQLRQKLEQLIDKGWEDDLVTMTAKLILRR